MLSDVSNEKDEDDLLSLTDPVSTQDEAKISSNRTTDDPESICDNLELVKDGGPPPPVQPLPNIDSVQPNSDNTALQKSAKVGSKESAKTGLEECARVVVAAATDALDVSTVVKEETPGEVKATFNGVNSSVSPITLGGYYSFQCCRSGSVSFWSAGSGSR